MLMILVVNILCLSTHGGTTLKPVVWLDCEALMFVSQRFYDRKPQGLNGALQDLGICFEGREHSGKTFFDGREHSGKIILRNLTQKS